MEEIYIHQHLGLGDHIICNGLIRNLYKKHKKINLFVKRHNILNVSFMFKDLFNLNILPINTDEDVYRNYNHNVLRIGFEHLNNLIQKHSIGWDEAFYKQLEITFNDRWDLFFVERDLRGEENLYKKLNPNNEKYSIIHSTGSDGINRIDYSKINKNLLQIEIKKEHTNNIFHYLSLLENADEIHCIDSSFLHLSDSVTTNGDLFFHNLNKTRNINESHKQKKIWKKV
jgi:hypothetical protein